ncbi:hypothetical protein C5167_023727 [Papaver somniferum]|uniref:Uncharacterized protein n=1 Tax=Papaver somniferum TaxID=3469 RepID=A0A4Y7JQ77_PAPSO|nr:hypothetical protein C5167_023727 [Papaver somniferum]
MLLNSEKQIQSKQRGIEVVLIEVGLGFLIFPDCSVIDFSVDARISRNCGPQVDHAEKLEKGVSELRTDNRGLEVSEAIVSSNTSLITGWWYYGNLSYGMGRYAQFSLADGGLMCDVVHCGDSSKDNSGLVVWIALDNHPLYCEAHNLFCVHIDALKGQSEVELEL